MINQVTLVGRLTKDPEVKLTTEGTPVAHITLAVNRHYRSQSGDFETDFVQCILWRKAAENTCKYCSKGSVLGVTGRLQTRHYDNREGKRVYVTEVVAESVRFLGPKPHEAVSVPGPASFNASAPVSGPAPTPPTPPTPAPATQVPTPAPTPTPEPKREAVTIGL